ncbi:MAG: hypothetical protein HYW51_03555 [Candidatus Doudnabacteria bacterium]|nr:hypothetical protein [Candidatus Doudnabacteria bacterium]
MTETSKKLLTRLAPILGAGAVGACPLCWIGSASLLTYLGLGALVPIWRWIVVILLLLALVGFAFDFRSHRKPAPLVLLVIGSGLLLLGRYVYGGADFDGWQIWGPGALIVLLAVIYNKRQFRKAQIINPKEHQQYHANI